MEPAAPTTGKRLIAYLSTLAIGGLTVYALAAQSSWETGRILLPISSIILAAILIRAAVRWSMPHYFALAAIPCLFGSKVQFEAHKENTRV